MSIQKLNRFIGLTVISDRTREWAMKGRLDEVLREYELDEEEIAEIVIAQPGSVDELTAVVHRMVARLDAEAKAESRVSSFPLEAAPRLLLVSYPAYS
ncbi:MAG TPA: hypothetical protein VJL59_14355 [Anaerolineales bacterium]|nr:hypothetical protein [Anaerolineales bacterium]